VPVKLPHLFSEAFEAPIWEMHLSGNYLLISTRNKEKFEVMFNLFDLTSNTFLWKDIVFEEPWWIGVSHFYNDVIVFHTYANSQDLEQKSIFGYNIIDKDVIWAFDQTSPVQMNEGSIVCLRIDEKEKVLININLEDGSFSDVELEENTKKKSSELISNLCHNPLHYVEGSTAFESVAKFLKLQFNIEILGACEYLEYKTCIIVSYFEKSDENLVNTLVILDEKMKIIDSYVLDSSLKGLASDTFFIVNEALIFVRNKNLLLGLLIEN
jgi:uncharacterized protein DUF4905